MALATTSPRSNEGSRVKQPLAVIYTRSSTDDDRS
ncbi:uncharacterized protein METZ01_LOCUS226439 [marine metagenome]|uniref:Uncharacterized protein n=1 Tax=marine metagenome TaxID=408172 RepID=A0A382GFS6_9ZZZZ